MNGFQSNAIFHHAMQIEPVPLEFAVSWFLLTHESAYFNQLLEKNESPRKRPVRLH